MCYIYLRLLFGIACLAYHTAITFALYQLLYPEFIVNSFDIKRAAATFVQFVAHSMANINVISEVTLYCIPVYCVQHGIELDNLSKLMLKKKGQNTQLSVVFLLGII